MNRSPIPRGTSELKRSEFVRKPAKKKKPKRDKLPSRAKLVKELDRLTSLIVRARDNGKCVLCGSAERLQCGHIFGRRSHGARFDIAPNGNCHAQCSGCNQRHNYEPWRYYRWFIGRFGQEVFDAMYTRWTKGHKYSRRELIEMVAEYTVALGRQTIDCQPE
jgi:hypothetical protein